MDNDQQRARNVWPVLVAIVLVVLSITIYTLWSVNRSQGTETGLYTTLSLDARVDSKTSNDIEKIEAQLATGVSPIEEAILKRGLAMEYVSIDLSESFKILRGVAADTRFAARDRALAVQLMGDIFLERAGGVTSVAEKYMFTEPPYSAMLDATDTDASRRVRNAIMKLYEHAISIAPTPTSEYRVAAWHASNGDFASAKQHVANGDAVLDVFFTSDEREQTLRAKAHWVRGVAVGEIGLGENDLAKIDDARTSFGAAIQILAPNGTAANPVRASEYVWTSFHFASLLERAALETDQKITATLLRDVVRNLRSRNSFNIYMERLVNGGEIGWSHITTAQLQQLAEREPVFGAYIDAMKYSK